MDLPEITPPNISGSPVKFLKEVKQELKKVKWPTKKEVTKMTGIVLGVSVLVGVFITIVDFILTKLMGVIIK